MNDADQIIQKNILQANQNYIIFDSYRYLYESTKMELEKEGYLTKIIDFNHPEQSDQCNILNIFTMQRILNTLPLLYWMISYIMRIISRMSCSQKA